MSAVPLTTWTMKWTSAATGQPVTAPLATFGIVNPCCTFRSQDDDEFTFEVKRSVTVPDSFAFGDAITLIKTVTTGASVVRTVWFVGTITKSVDVGNAQTEMVRYIVSGPWWLLKRTLMQIASNAYNASCVSAPVKMTKVVLYQDPTTGAPITTGQQILNAITFGLTLGIVIAPGTTPSFISVPLEETRDLTLSDVIRRSLQWTPDAVSWFDYTSGVPVFNCQQRAFLSAVSLAVGSAPLTGFSLEARTDLVPSGVRFNYVGSALCNVQVPNGCADPTTGVVNTSGGAVASTNPVQVQTIVQDAVGLPDFPGGLNASIDLTQLTATSTEPAPIGLASAYYVSLLTPTWDGTIALHEQECSGTLRPGKVVNLTGGQSGWATMNAQVQEVRETLYAGETSVTFGTPGHLQPQNFATLFQMIRRRALVISGLAAVNTSGSGNGTACQQGIHPETQKVLNKVAASGTAIASAIGPKGLQAGMGTGSAIGLTVCVGGVGKSISVYGPPGQ